MVGNARVHASARDRLRLGSLGAVGAAALYLPFIMLTHPEVASRAAVYSAWFIPFAAILYLAARRARMSDTWMTAAGALLLIAMGGGLAHSFVLIRAPALTAFMAVLLLAAGALQSSTRWLVTVVVVCTTGWLAVGFPLCGASFALPATALVCVAIVAVLVHLVVMRYLEMLDRLRERDRRHHGELSRALDAARHELAERQRAEAERQRAEAEREALREQLLHSQKLEAIGTLAGGVAHDMNNVLAAILGVAEFIRADAPAATAEGLDQIIEAARRGGDLTRNLLGFGRRGKYHRERIELGHVVDGVTRLLARTLPKTIDLVSDTTGPCAVEGDASQLDQALMNLCLNAADAMSGSGTVRIRTRQTHLCGPAALAAGLPDGLYAAVSVADSGCGMTPETRSRIFEPFFTTKEQGRGTGLGLSMVYGTVANHGGAVTVDTAPARGTTITLYLPVLPAAAAPTDPPAPTPTAIPIPTPIPTATPTEIPIPTATEIPIPTATEIPIPTPTATSIPEPASTGLILVVDDEEILRRVTRRILERAGYRVITACDGAEAIALYRAHQPAIRAVVLDMAMPGMGGAECFAALRTIDSSARIILASGFAVEHEASGCLAAGAIDFLEKPYSGARLLEVVAHAQAAATAPTTAA